MAPPSHIPPTIAPQSTGPLQTSRHASPRPFLSRPPINAPTHALHHRRRHRVSNRPSQPISITLLPSSAPVLSPTSSMIPGFDPNFINDHVRTPPAQIVSWTTSLPFNRLSDLHAPHTHLAIVNPLASPRSFLAQFPPPLLNASPAPVLSPAQLLPQFCSKPVCQLSCRHCKRAISNRAMKAVLLADSRVELFSTDLPLKGAVSLINDPYVVTANCKCQIRDTACLGCGNCIGYHVTKPCSSCLTSCNNGQRTMFTDALALDRRHPMTGDSLTWGQLPSVNSLIDSSGSASLMDIPRHEARGLTSAHLSSHECPLDSIIEDNPSEMGFMGGWIIGGVSCDMDGRHAEHLIGQR